MPEQNRKRRRRTAWLLMLLIIGLRTAAAGETAAPDPYTTPGSIVTLGRFEQDNNPDNGPEAIEWIVLETEDGKALLLSRYILDARPYHEDYTDITWEGCSLRAWLNGTFFSTAFSAEEQAAIPETGTDNSAAQQCRSYRTDGGRDTRDRIFLLSYAEAERFFENDRARKCAVTDYALARGAYTSYSAEDKRETGLWWLRSPGNFQYRVSVVYTRGALNVTYAAKESGCVRPALRVDPDLLPVP